MTSVETSYMYLGIRGDFDPVEVTSRISMTPWKSVAKHSKSVEKRIPRCALVDYGKVELTSECPDLGEMSKELFEQLSPYRDEFIAISQHADITITCNTCLWMIHDLHVSTPPIGFCSELVRFLGEIGASIDVDIYRDDEYQVPHSSPFYHELAD